MRKKRLVLLLFILFLISPIFVSFLTLPTPFNFAANNNREDSKKLKIETPKLSYGHNWKLDGVGICTAPNDQIEPKIASDGQGGSLITWVDNRGWYNDIYAQKVSSRGDMQWQKNGVPVSITSNNNYNPQICSDGTGGAIIVWVDYRNGNSDVYAQRVNSNGNIQWTVNGIAICTGNSYQYIPQICSDGVGGAIIVWRDYRNGNYDIFAQKINSTGNTQWINNGTALCTAISGQHLPQICSDGVGGAIIIWRDSRNGNQDIYAQRIDSNGNTQWTDNGTAICTDYDWQEDPQICSDGAGGAIITWYDDRNVSYDIFAQLIDFNGITQWTANGTLVCGDGNEQKFSRICNDNTGGAIITWRDYRNGNYDIYAQRINAIGNAVWTTNGIAITTAVNSQTDMVITSDGEGGAIITWVDYRNGNYDIYAQKIDSNGVLLLTENGAPICITEDSQLHPQICNIGEGSAIITWDDKRSGYKDIYAQRVFNYTGDAELSLITPESKLYTEPMSSYYLATYGFENDEMGDDPADWVIEEAGGTVQIVNSYSGHSKVVELHETSDDFTGIYNNIGSRTSGTVEWWVSVNKIDDWFELGIYSGDSNDGIHMGFANDGYIKYNDGSVWSVIMPYSTNVWYHFKVEWDVSTNWHLSINGTSQDGGSGYSYRNSPSSLDQVRFQISDAGAHQDQYMYIDAVGFSWDPHYKLGDNWNEGLLLGMTLNSTLLTLEYSLDNQANVSISGNTTISVPKDGQHSIRVFGSTFFRYFAQSEINYFIVDTKLPEIQIHSPIQGDTAGTKPPFIMVSIVEANIVSKWYTIGDSEITYELPNLFGLIDENAWDAVPLGSIAIRVYVEDIAGNIVSEQVTIIKELDTPVTLIFNIVIISMFAIIGALMVLVFREISIPRER